MQTTTRNPSFMFPSSIITAPGLASREVRLCSHHALMANVPRFTWTPGAEWPRHAGSSFMTVGSVEFCTSVMHQHGIREPVALGFPEVLRPYLGREIRPGTVADLDLLGPDIFVKPRKAIKTFTGFVYAAQPADPASEFECEQREILFKLPYDFALWFSEVVSWQCEWRVYVARGKIIGMGRYDADGADDAPLIDQAAVGGMVRAYTESGEAPDAFALDVGVTPAGRTTIVEVNDAWAIGYYSDAAASMSGGEYFQFLWTRWQQIRRAQH